VIVLVLVGGKSTIVFFIMWIVTVIGVTAATFAGDVDWCLGNWFVFHYAWVGSVE
jgi:hypothetical protein